VSTLAFPDAAPISAVIADDEAQLASYLEKLLQGCWPQLEIVGRAGNGEQALQLIRSLRPDVAFLDIRMPGLTGLEVAERLAAERSPGAAAACRIVFVTAYDQYAIEAFERAAVDYLLKPVTAERLAGTVARLRTAPTAPATADASLGELRRLIGALRQAPPRLHWLQVGVRDEVALLPVAEVDLDGRPGVALEADLTPVAVPPPGAALLPGLDPTPMGWQSREWFLGPHGPALFDRTGNIGPTVWWDGRIVGGWAQRSSGEVVFRPLEDVGSDAVAAIAAEAARLESWLGELRVTPRFRTPLERDLSA